MPPVNKAPRGDHEVVPEAHSQVAGRTHDLSSRQRPMCRVSNAGRSPVAPDEAMRAILRGKPYLTGSYVEEKGRFNLFINQANLHLEVLVAFIDTGQKPVVNDDKDERLKKSLFHLQGDYDPDAFNPEVFHLSADWKRDNQVGKLLVDHADGERLRIVIDEDVKPLDHRIHDANGTTVVRVDDRPALFERLLAHDLVPAKFRTYHWWALTPQQERFLASDFVFATRDTVDTNLGLKELSLLEAVDHYYTQSREVAAHVRADVNERNAEAIDGVLLELQSKAYAHIHVAHFDSLFQVVRFHLSTKKVKPAPDASARPLPELLQEIANDNRTARLKNFAAFGFHPKKVECAFEVSYSVMGTSVDLGLGVGGWAGTITLTQTKGTGWPEGPHTFPIAFLTGSAGFSVGYSAAKSGSGTAESSHRWLPEHLPGPCSGSDFSASAGVGVGVDAGVGYLAIDGTRSAGSPTSPLVCVFSPAAWKKYSDAISGGTLGAGLETGFIKGKIYPPGKKVTPKDAADLLPSSHAVNYTRYVKQKTTIHYCTNDAQLSQEARDLLDIVAALELPAFTTGGSKLRIIGYADRVGTPEANKELAVARALNVETYLRDSLVRLEDRGDLDIKFSAQGEGEIERGEDGVENPKFRRTDLFLNGQIILMLEGVPDGVPAE